MYLNREYEKDSYDCSHLIQGSHPRMTHGLRQAVSIALIANGVKTETPITIVKVFVNVNVKRLISLSCSMLIRAAISELSLMSCNIQIYGRKYISNTFKKIHICKKDSKVKINNY